MAANHLADRYFYHSFPRRGEKEEKLDHGLTILELIRDNGLLMTPEMAHWEYSHADGIAPRRQSMVEYRISFTELEPGELKDHAETFGPFALEYDIQTLKSLGAIPVFYVPKTQEGEPASELGSTLVMHLIDAMRMVHRMDQVKRVLANAPAGQERIKIPLEREEGPVEFDLGIKDAQETLELVGFLLAPPDSLARFLEAAHNYFYPDGNPGDPLAYYRQREWRIAGDPAIRGEALMEKPTDKQVAALLALDPDFFGRRFPPDGVTVSNVSRHGLPQAALVDNCCFFASYAGKTALQYARRVIVPEVAQHDAQRILAEVQGGPELVTLESIDRGIEK